MTDEDVKLASAVGQLRDKARPANRAEWELVNVADLRTLLRALDERTARTHEAVDERNRHYAAMESAYTKLKRLFGEAADRLNEDRTDLHAESQITTARFAVLLQQLEERTAERNEARTALMRVDMNALAAREASVARMREALAWARKFGHVFDHFSNCEIGTGGDCTCGYDRGPATFGSLDGVLSETPDLAALTAFGVKCVNAGGHYVSSGASGVDHPEAIVAQILREGGGE